MNRRTLLGILLAFLTATFSVVPQVAFSLEPKECACPQGCSPASQKSCPASCSLKPPETAPATATAPFRTIAPISLVETVLLSEIEPPIRPLLSHRSLRDEIPRPLHTSRLDASRAPPALA